MCHLIACVSSALLVPIFCSGSVFFLLLVLLLLLLLLLLVLLLVLFVVVVAVEWQEYKWVSLTDPQVTMNGFTDQFWTGVLRLVERAKEEGRFVNYQSIVKEHTPFHTPAVWTEGLSLAPRREALKSIWQ